MRKKFNKISIILLLILITFSVKAEQEQKTPYWFIEQTNQIRIIMVDTDLNFEYLKSDVYPIIKNDYTLVPIRAIAEKLNFNVEWNEIKQNVHIYDNFNNLELTIGSTSIIANSKEESMEIAPLVINKRTFVPLRYVAEFFGKKVIWLEGIDSNYYIWISFVDLLKDEDVNVPNDNNYYVLWDESTPVYTLKEHGVTARGIRVGDEYEKVIEKYGEVHKKQVNGDEVISATYLTPYFPNSEGGSTLTFNFKNNKVISVAIDPSN